MTVWRVKKAQWKLDSGAWTTSGVSATDGAFDEETDPYTFTPTSPVPSGAHTFYTRAINDFGHKSTRKKDTLTIL